MLCRAYEKGHVSGAGRKQEAWAQSAPMAPRQIEQSNTDWQLSGQLQLGRRRQTPHAGGRVGGCTFSRRGIQCGQRQHGLVGVRVAERGQRQRGRHGDGAALRSGRPAAHFVHHHLSQPFNEPASPVKSAALLANISVSLEEQPLCRIWSVPRNYMDLIQSEQLTISCTHIVLRWQVRCQVYIPPSPSVCAYPRT